MNLPAFSIKCLCFFDASGAPVFADNWNSNHDLASMKRLLGRTKRVVLNVHDPFYDLRSGPSVDPRQLASAESFLSAA